MNINNIILLKSNKLQFYLDIVKNIITIEIFGTLFSKEEFILFIEYFKTFWYISIEYNKKYFMIIKINNIIILPLDFYDYIILNLLKLENIFKDNLHASSFLCKDDKLFIIKPLIDNYKFIKPYSIFTNYEDIIIYFKNIKI